MKMLDNFNYMQIYRVENYVVEVVNSNDILTYEMKGFLKRRERTMLLQIITSRSMSKFKLERESYKRV